ncbi:MAG: acetyl-CoA hydrolase/transferase family protein [Christensenellales bacterium]|jgi:acyl-CoA hydrolase
MSNSYMNDYKDKLRLPSEVIGMIRDGDYISAGQIAGGPISLFKELHKNTAKNVTLQASIILGDYPFLHQDCGVFLESWFFGASERKLHNEHKATYVPAHLSQHASRKLSFTRPRMFWGVSSPMDEHGNLCVSFGIAYEMEMLEAADIVVLEINDSAPKTLGENTVHISKVDFLVEGHNPRWEFEPSSPGEIDRAIGKNVAHLVDDRSVIQLGIGTIPDAVAMNFFDKKDLGVHTEMITDSMVQLYNAGVITNRCKQIYKNKLVGTFVYGSKALYDFVDNNPAVQLIRGKTVNDPFVIAQNDNMISINTCLQLDLKGQVCSEAIGSTQYSGIGGQFDTAYGAQRSKGGKSIIALRSTAKKGEISTIVPILDNGAIVTLGRSDVDYVVTEYGIAHLRGRNISQRVEALVSVAHPKFRAYLRDQADMLKIW